MKIELKNVKISEHLSEETTAFTADIFVDGKKAGYARNDGRGGCTEYHAFLETIELLRSAEKFALTLPPIVYEFNGKKHEFDSNLESVIDNIIGNILKEKEEKKIEKLCLKGVFKSTPFGVVSGISFKITLKDMIKTYGKKGVAHIQSTYDKLKSELKENEKIVNKNLEELGVKL
jgi:hypothetical protein